MTTKWILPLAAALTFTTLPSPAGAVNWTLTLDTPNQVAAPGGTAVYTGTITNTTGAPLSLDAGLDFTTSPEVEQFTIDFAAAILALDLIIPTSGYTGAIFEVTWNNDAIPGSFGVGELVFASGVPATPGALAAPFTLGTPVIGPFCSSGTGVLAGGNAIASNDENGTPAIVYNDVGAGTLVYVTSDGSAWSATPIASGIGAEAAPSLAMDLDLVPHVAFHDDVAGDLVHAWNTGTGWQTEIVESTGDVGAEPSLVVDPSGDIHVSYYDVTNGDLRYARQSGGVWTAGLVEATGDVGRHSAVIADVLGQAYISYYDATSEDLKLARRSGITWLTEVVDGTGSRGTWTSIGLRDGVLSISYRDATLGTPALRFATGTPGSWTTEAVDASGNPGFGSSLALNVFGQPRIAYFDATSSEVRFATKTGAVWSILPVVTGGSGQLSLNRSATDEPYLSYAGGGELIFASITTCGVSSAPESPAVPLLVLHPNRPNPFRGSTTFGFALARASDVTVRVYDAAGRLVAEPVRGAFTAGPQEVTWDGTGRNGRRLASGRYVYEVIGGGERRTGRLVLLR